METLKKRSDFIRVRHGQYKHFKGFILQWKKNPNGDTRFGFTASKKFSKTAVGRNKAKRKMREYVNSREWDIGFDYVLIAKKGINDMGLNIE